jgi:hypothetical protein
VSEEFAVPELPAPAPAAPAPAPTPDPADRADTISVDMPTIWTPTSYSRRS